MLMVLVLSLTQIAASAPRPFTVAVVRDDGRLVPFAAWNGASWEAAVLAGALSTAPALDDISGVWSRQGERLPRTWRVWRAAGGPPLWARVRAAEVVDHHCERGLALATNLRMPPTEEFAGVESTFGVAMHDLAVHVRTIEVVAASTLRSAAERVIRPAFDSREKARAEETQRTLPHDRPIPAVRITRLLRQAGRSRSPLYFEAERVYATGPGGDLSCPFHTIMTGWLGSTDDGGLALLDSSVFVTDCDRKEARSGLPLAALRVASHWFWIMREHGYEDETFHIVETGPAHVREALEVEGGGC
jgi:hypothetical protein